MSEIMGVTVLHVDLKVTAAEMREWEPARISAFFNGIAQIKRAAEGLPFGDLSNSTIDDGFGNTWSITCPECKQQSMEIVRPGKAQCGNCG